MSKYCARRHIIIKSANQGTTEYKSIPLFCGSWDCPACAKQKWHNLRKKIEQTFENDVYLLTLTYNQNGKSLKDVWSKLGASWNRLLSYIRTVSGKKIKYIRIVEPHKSNFPHLHVILDKPLDFITDLKLLESHGFGSVAHQKTIPLKAGIAYLSKYLTKGHWSPEASALRKRFRVRVFTSSRLKRIEKKSSKKWELASSSSTLTKNALDFAEIFREQHDKGNKLKSLNLTYGVLSAIFDQTGDPGNIDFSVLSFQMYQTVHGRIFEIYNCNRDGEYERELFINFCETFNCIKSFELRPDTYYYNSTA